MLLIYFMACNDLNKLLNQGLVTIYHKNPETFNLLGEFLE